jgi:hypothetical protein
MDIVNEFLDHRKDSKGSYDQNSSDTDSVGVIEVMDYDPELDKDFGDKVLNIYLTELYTDLLNREIDSAAKKLSFKVFSEVSTAGGLIGYLTSGCVVCAAAGSDSRQVFQNDGQT